MARIESSQALVGKTVTRIDGSTDKIVGLLAGGYKMAEGRKLSARNLTKVKNKFVEIEKTDVRLLEEHEGYVLVKKEASSGKSDDKKPSGKPNDDKKPSGKSSDAKKTGGTRRVVQKPVIAAVDETTAGDVLSAVKTAIASALSHLFGNDMDVSAECEFNASRIVVTSAIDFVLPKPEPKAVSSGLPERYAELADAVNAPSKYYEQVVPKSLAKKFEGLVVGSVMTLGEDSIEFLFLGFNAETKEVFLLNTETGKKRRLAADKFATLAALVSEDDQDEEFEDEDGEDEESEDEESEDEDDEDDEESEDEDDEDEDDEDEESEDDAYQLGPIDSAIMKRLNLKSDSLSAVAKALSEEWEGDESTAASIIPGVLVDSEDGDTYILHGVNAEGKVILKLLGAADDKGVRKTTVAQLCSKYTPVPASEEETDAEHDEDEATDFSDLSEDELREEVLARGLTTPRKAEAMDADDLIALLSEE